MILWLAFGKWDHSDGNYCKAPTVVGPPKVSIVHIVGVLKSRVEGSTLESSLGLQYGGARGEAELRGGAFNLILA